MNLPMMAVGQVPVTMSSREITNLVESRHDNVKQSIERLAARGVIVRPPIGEEQDTDAMGRQRTASVYLFDKRSSSIVVAQLSPEFTARVVDRWQELERQRAPAMLTGPQLLAAALIEAHATLQVRSQQIEAMREDVATQQRLSKADGSLSVTEAAMNLALCSKDPLGLRTCAERIDNSTGSAA